MLRILRDQQNGVRSWSPIANGKPVTMWLSFSKSTLYMDLTCKMAIKDGAAYVQFWGSALFCISPFIPWCNISTGYQFKKYPVLQTSPFPLPPRKMNWIISYICVIAQVNSHWPSDNSRERAAINSYNDSQCEIKIWTEGMSLAWLEDKPM